MTRTHTSRYARNLCRFVTDCVHSDGDSIDEMNRAARDVSLATLAKHCEGVLDWAREVGYDGLYSSRSGLALGKDFAVSFCKSTYRGVPCYFIRWSRIEHIWTLGGVNPPEPGSGRARR